MEKEQVDFYAHALSYRFLGETEKPWRGESRKRIEFELFAAAEPSMKRLNTLLKKELTRTSKLEQSYLESVAMWRDTITTMLTRLDPTTVRNYLSLTPSPVSGLSSAVQHAEFITLNQYLHQRRNIDECPDDELGALAMLLTAFQRKIKIEK